MCVCVCVCCVRVCVVTTIVSTLHQPWAVQRGFSAIVTCLDPREPLPSHMQWLQPDAPDPPIPPPERRSKIMERKRRSTIARRLMDRRNELRLSQLHFDALEQARDAEAANAGAGAGAGAGATNDDADTVYDSADSAMDSGSEEGDDGDYSSDDEREKKRVFVKPAHLVIKARDVDTVQGWAELLPHVRIV